MKLFPWKNYKVWKPREYNLPHEWELTRENMELWVVKGTQSLENFQ